MADDRGEVLALGGHKQRAVLAILVAHGGETVSGERLIDELWGERAPASASNTIHVYVSNLRKALGEGLLITRPTGYELRTADVDLDSVQFTSLLEEGSRELRRGRPRRASDMLQEALGLWRGRAYADFAYEPFARAEIARLEEARLTGVEERVVAQLQLGAHASLIGELEALSAEHPVRERLHEQLMLALYRSGRQAEALGTFARIREHLAHELGLEPGPALKALQAQILRQDPALAAPSGSDELLAGRPGRLLERAAELSTLHQQLAEVERVSRGRLVVVRGEAGIGKTALLRSFCDAVDGSARVLWAGCDPLFTPRPLGPLLDIGRATGGELPKCIETAGKPHDVAAALLGELQLDAPTVLVLDDLQWADEATTDVVRLISRRVHEAPILLVASYRDDELGRAHPLRAVLGQLPSDGTVTRMELTGLSPESIAQLAESSSVDPVELHRTTAGNPFFATEVLAADADRVPATVRDAVLARAARLGADARLLLDATAIIPGRAPAWLLEALAEGVIGALEECLASGMLMAEPDGAGFRHELARLVIEESLAPDWRLILHRRALAALAEPAIGARDLAQLAHHAEGAADGPAVLRFAPAAAARAGSVGAHREAAAQYARALRFAARSEPADRAVLLMLFANECYLTDARREALEALDEALVIHRELGDACREGAVQRKRAELLGCAGRLGEGRAAAREAMTLLEHAPPGSELARAYATLAGFHARADEAEETVLLGERAAEIAMRTGDAKALVESLNLVGSIQGTRGLPEGREKLERSLDLAKQAGLESEAGVAYINLISVLHRRREWALAERYIAAGMDYCRQHGLEAWLDYMVSSKAESELTLGHWQQAADAARSILDAPPSSVLGPPLVSLLVLAIAELRRGDPGYQPLLDEALERAREVDELQYLAPVAAARAEAAWLEGRPEAIDAETAEAFHLARRLGEPAFVADLACWRWRAGILHAAPTGAAEPCRAQIAGRHEQAACFWRECGCPYEAALALADGGDEDSLQRAHEELRRLGAQPAAAVVARRLRAAIAT